MGELVKYKKFAVGYTTMAATSFTDLILPYISVISEVFFSWPGMVSGRTLNWSDNTVETQTRLIKDLNWCHQNGIHLDLLFNGNCYGESCFSIELREKVYSVLNTLKGYNLLPEVVTTTSQFIAKCIKVKYPEIDIRASVNMRIESTKAMEFVSDIFDSFYICRDIQRDLETVKDFSLWASAHNKKICMLVNSACLRCCPVQTFHDNFLCHGSEKNQEQVYLLRFPYRLCERHFQDEKNYIDYLRMSWIRPEDLHFYEPFVSVMKLATRDIPRPDLVLSAYCTGSYEGNVLDYLGMNNYDAYLDNKAFPDNWVESKIAQNCAINCKECGQCDEIFKKIYHRQILDAYSFTPSTFNFEGSESSEPYSIKL